MTCESDVGVGTKFRVIVPLPASDPPLSSELARSDTVINTPASAVVGLQPAVLQAGLRILLVEDNRLSATVGVKFLSRLGMHVQTATNGREAVDIAMKEHDRPDLVLMDCLMPVMNGYDATRRIRELEDARGLRPLPIVALSAISTADDRQRCVEAGMDAFLAKPFTDVDLVAMLSGLRHGAPSIAGLKTFAED
jgi:CheY-like chemotaxis protein